jgi:hypothetical protein
MLIQNLFYIFHRYNHQSKFDSPRVKLCCNDKDISISSNVLKHVEIDRLTVIPKVSTLSHTTYLDDEEAIAISDGQLLSQPNSVVRMW